MGQNSAWLSRSADPDAPLMKAEVSCTAVEAGLCAWQLRAMQAVLGALYSPDSASIQDALASQALSGVSSFNRWCRSRHPCSLQRAILRGHAASIHASERFLLKQPVDVDAFTSVDDLVQTLSDTSTSRLCRTPLSMPSQVKLLSQSSMF